MVLAHVTTPGVARGTELGPLRSLNDINGPRNFFFLAGFCTLICNYLKSRSITGHDGYVAHFLPKRVARLFIYLIGPIREVAIAFARIVMADNYHAYHAYLFVTFGKTVDSGTFSNILRRYTLEHLLTPLTISPYRQAIKAILRAVMHVIDDQQDTDDALDASFGHSSAIGNTWYGLVHEDLPGLTENKYVDAMHLATRYHGWLGFSVPNSQAVFAEPNPDSNNPSSALTDRLVSMLDRFEKVLPALEGLQQLNKDDIQTRILDRYVPLIENTITTTLAHKVPWWSHLQIPPSPISSAPIITHPSRSTALKKLFRDDSVNFRSLEQGQALEVVSRRHPHALVVLRTGGGKSAIYQAPSLTDTKGFRLVVIPYISLMDQAVADANAKGIPNSSWSPVDCHVNPFTDRLVFTAIEHFGMPAFMPWLQSSHANGYLNGVVVDKAHDILLSRDYRDSFCAMGWLGELGCQVVLLSGTVSPSVELILWKVRAVYLG
jgi:hypothetical protein